MDKSALVEKDTNEGADLIRELETAFINVHSALWLYDSELENWRLIIASKNVDFQSPKKAYSAIKRVIDKIKKNNNSFGISLENISVVSPNHPLIKTLGIAIGTGSTDISAIRFSRSTINNSYIEDAYIYRIQS